ncbi:MAG: dienelactone hydrolase family protein [Candidatus Acidiferrales bacterium]
MKRLSFALAALLFLATVAAAAPAPAKTETVHYKSGDETVSAYLATPGTPGRHPGLVVIHEWWGQTPWVRGEADKFADQGYVALAIDLYRGKVTSDPKEAAELSRTLPRDRAVQDLEAAYSYLASRRDVVKSKIGSVGWCMGGGYSLQLAEHEPRLAACIVNYGEMPTDPASIQAIHARLLGNFGADDQVIPPAAVHLFEKALQADGKSIDAKIYDGAPHAFENPGNKTGYRPEAAADSWTRMVAFLATTLK